MWQCIDCGKIFQLPYTEHICPYCGSKNIITNAAKILDDAINSFDIEDSDYEDIGIEPPENLLFDEQDLDDLDSLDENDYGNLPIWNLELSFEDLDSHEYDLLDDDPLPDENGNITPCYYTDMLERFTHTFVDSCFMPI